MTDQGGASMRRLWIDGAKSSVRLDATAPTSGFSRTKCT